MSSAPSAALVAALAAQFAGVTARPSSDHPACNVPPAHLPAVARHLRDDLGFDLLTDVTAVDWDRASPRFTALYHFYSTRRHEYVRLACDCPDDAAPEVPSLSGLYAGADWHEREAYDMFGLRFTGHPDLRRILMWEEYPHFPLRKEFPLAGLDVPLPGADVAAATGATVKPAPMMGGPFVAPQRGGVMSEAEPGARDESWTERAEKPQS